jgi:hypothetical protein
MLHFLLEERRVNAPGDFVDGDSAFLRLGSGGCGCDFDFDFRVERQVRYLGASAGQERDVDRCAGPRGDGER